VFLFFNVICFQPVHLSAAAIELKGVWSWSCRVVNRAVAFMLPVDVPVFRVSVQY
jgi:hypothetical protein